jgi:adenylate cyclase class 2
MGIEVEKKYRLTAEQRASLAARLTEAGATERKREFETNTLYAGNNLDPESTVLRLRRTELGATLTYKERRSKHSGIKHNREDETSVGDAEALHDIFTALGYTPSLVYEKRRATWDVAGVELVIDELPFGWFAEIEGTEEEIAAAEAALALTEVEAVTETYPQLTERHGRHEGRIIAARFD